MNYELNKVDETKPDESRGLLETIRRLWPLIVEEKAKMLLALVSVLTSSALIIIAPVLIGKAIDTQVLTGNYPGVLRYGGVILLVYIASALVTFAETRIMGTVGQRVLFRLRNRLFHKLQELPVAFFNQNKAGDLISRINNDTDKLNMFLSQSLIQFLGNIFILVFAAVAMLVLQPRLGTAALGPALLLLVLTRLTSAWIKRRNTQNLRALGALSADVQETLDNFKVIIAFNRRDYFRKRFAAANEKNYKAAIGAGIANTTYPPVFGFASQLAQLVVIMFGLLLISRGQFSYGLLISFLVYVNRFYDPLRQMAAIWATFQTALAAWDRISEILNLETNLLEVPEAPAAQTAHRLELAGVQFAYPNGRVVLDEVNIVLDPGKTYALVGPTGGGKTTTASLMARLYDPTKGSVYLNGKDLRSYTAAERAQKIGFILQEPFLFSGTVQENILYGNDAYHDLTTKALEKQLKKDGLDTLLARFDKGLETEVSAQGDGMSLGQKQLIAFMRAVLRHPEILILDEATANVDTVTEKLLEAILRQLPSTTTRVVIAHRLNTIENADQIYFVNGGEVTAAGSLKEAVAMLTEGARQS